MLSKSPSGSIVKGLSNKVLKKVKSYDKSIFLGMLYFMT